MKTLQKTLTLLGCLAALAVVLSGCARERRGPFDVPAAVPSSSGYAAESGAASGDLARAVAEIRAANVYFAFDRADIRPEYRETLDRVALALIRHPSVRISIQGHTDERGGSEYNYDLGARRARSAFRYLLNAGVPASRVDMVTFGKYSPAMAGQSEYAWSRNRRVEFIVLTTCY